MIRYVHYEADARQDMADIFDYLDIHASESIADRFYDAVRKTVEQLLRSPNLGERHPSCNPKLQGMRKWRVDGFPNHVIFYRPTEDKLEILRVFHGARDYAAMFNGE
jgi:toxin ParE1/3/4